MGAALLDETTASLPFGVAVFEPSGRPPSGEERTHSLVGVHAVGASAVGDDFPIRRKLGEQFVELVGWDGDGSGDVSGVVFGSGPHVDEGRLVAL